MMCDTMVATPQSTMNGVMLFGKNSDREPNEAHYLEMVPSADHTEGSRVKCTYINIPQVAHTYRVLLAKPFWIWGAEMGVNEHGLAIGNEAIFSKVSPRKDGVLLGMDLLRLGLERARTAPEAVKVITDLLEKYGQGGNGEYERVLYYHNSYLLADPKEAWVLETVDRHWAARQIDGIYSISNGLTIGSEWDLCSPDLVEYAVQRGWCRGVDDFNFAKCYSDFLFTTFSSSTSRRKRTMDILSQELEQISVATIISALRDHGENSSGSYRPDQGITQQTVCAHANFGPICIAQTTGSLVAYLHPDRPAIFVTGTAAPCTSLFKPVWMDVPLPENGPVPTGIFDESTAFWKHELIHRAAFIDYQEKLKVFRADQVHLEDKFISGSLDLLDEPVAQRAEYSASCFNQAAIVEDEWLEIFKRMPKNQRQTWYHKLAWGNVNKSAGIARELEKINGR